MVDTVKWYALHTWLHRSRQGRRRHAPDQISNNIFFCIATFSESAGKNNRVNGPHGMSVWYHSCDLYWINSHRREHKRARELCGITRISYSRHVHNLKKYFLLSNGALNLRRVRGIWSQPKERLNDIKLEGVQGKVKFINRRTMKIERSHGLHDGTHLTLSSREKIKNLTKNLSKMKITKYLTK